MHFQNNKMRCNKLRSQSGDAVEHNVTLVEWGSTYLEVSLSVQFSRSVVSNCLWPHELQHARPPYPSPTPGVHSDLRPSSQWCHPAISSSVVPFSSCPQSLPASESFPMSQFFVWGGQSTGVSALASFLPKKSQGWSPSEWTGWISLQSLGTLISTEHNYNPDRLQEANSRPGLCDIFVRSHLGAHTPGPYWLRFVGTPCVHVGAW